VDGGAEQFSDETSPGIPNDPPINVLAQPATILPEQNSTQLAVNGGAIPWRKKVDASEGYLREWTSREDPHETSSRLMVWASRSYLEF